MIQFTYNMLEQEAEDTLFPLALGNGIGIVAREPLACGLLTGKYDVDSRFPKSDHRRGWSRGFLEEGTRRVGMLKSLERKDRTLIQAAIRFSLSHEAVSVVIPGAKTVEQVEENIGAAGIELNHDEIGRIRKLYRNDFLPSIPKL